MSLYFREGREEMMKKEGLTTKAKRFMACHNCSCTISKTSKFCSNCGKPVAKSKPAPVAPKRLAYFIALHDQLEREMTKVPLGKDLETAIKNMEQRLEHCPDGDESLKIAKQESKKDHYKLAALAMLQREQRPQ